MPRANKPQAEPPIGLAMASKFNKLNYQLFIA